MVICIRLKNSKYIHHTIPFLFIRLEVQLLYCSECPHNTSQSGGCPKDVIFGHWSYPLDVSWRA